MTRTPIATPSDVVTAAMAIAKDAAEGRLTPADLEAQAVAELRALVGTVIGEGDPLFALQVEIARGVLAVGGVPTDELAEWLAVARHRAGEPLSAPEPVALPVDPLPAVSPASVAHSPETVPLDALVDTLTEDDEAAANSMVEPAVVVPLRPVTPSGDYDPLAGWQPGGTRRR